MTERLREIEQRCEKATPGPWEHTYYEVRDEHDVNLDASKCAGKCPGKMGCECTYLLSNCILSSEDADFIAHAREDIPYLLSVIKEQADTIQELSFKLLGISFNSLVDVKQLLSEKPILQKLMESNGEHSEDAKPLDGTVQE